MEKIKSKIEEVINNLILEITDDELEKVIGGSVAYGCSRGQ